MCPVWDSRADYQIVSDCNEHSRKQDNDLLQWVDTSNCGTNAQSIPVARYDHARRTALSCRAAIRASARIGDLIIFRAKGCRRQGRLQTNHVFDRALELEGSAHPQGRLAGAGPKAIVS